MLLSLSPFTFFIYRYLPPVFSLSPLSNSPFISIIEGQRPSMPAAYATESIPLIYCRHENFENTIIYDDLFSWYFEVCVPRKKLVNSFSLWTRSHHLLIVTSYFLLRYVIIMPWVRVIIISKRFSKFTWRIFTNGKIFLVPIQNFFPPESIFCLPSHFDALCPCPQSCQGLWAFSPMMERMIHIVSVWK